LDNHIRLEHGSGGVLSRELVEDVIFPRLKSVSYPSLSDATEIAGVERMCMTTDTFVVDPIFFPGGDIGKLAVYGTCNDLAVSGARPKYLSLGFVIEEGFPVIDLKRLVDSITEAAGSAGVAVVTGDTKVVPEGRGGGIYINSCGIGEKVYPSTLGAPGIKAGDAVVLSGPIGAHGMAILAMRESLPVGKNLLSDCANLFPLCSDLYDLGQDLRVMRDATRGGVAAVLNELVSELSFGILVKEPAIPVDIDVKAVSGILGLNPLEVANEGVFVAVVKATRAAQVLEMLSAHPVGKYAAVIGEVTEDYSGKVYLETTIGGRRILDLPRGLLLPRIC
jgi:hydrogenase expression/formation protein HypE